jgi:signal transduction histidine kinase
VSARDPRVAQPLLAALLDEAREPILALDENGTILIANGAASAMLGRARGHLAGKPFASLLALGDRRAFRNVFAHVDISPVELEVSLSGVGTETLVVRELPGQTPRCVSVTVSGGNAQPPAPTPRRDASSEIVAALDRFFVRFPRGVIGFYPDRRIAFANIQGRHLLSDPHLRVGRRFDPPPELEDIVQRVLAVPNVAQATRVELHGRIVSATGIGGDRRRPAVLMLEDITRSGRELTVMHEFLRNAAHQLRTPLTAIATAIEVLQAGAKERPEERDRFLEHIGAHSHRLIRVARGLLVLARAQAGEPMQLDFVQIAPVLHELARQATPTEGVELLVECPDGVEALADRDLAHEAIAALVENAVEHTRSGTIRLTAETENGTVTIAVVDEGGGILPEHRERIFEPFYRPFATGNGHGLGLAIAAQAVRAMAGELTAEDAEGGTRFTIRLPSATKRQ